MVKKSDKTWSIGEGNGKSLQYSCLENIMKSMKRQKDMTLKDELPRSIGAQYATRNQGQGQAQSQGQGQGQKRVEKTPEAMKRESQSKINAQMCMWLVMEVNSDAVKTNIAWEPGMLGP